MADGTTEFNAENVKNLAVNTYINVAIGYGVGKITGKFATKWGDKLIEKIGNSIEELFAPDQSCELQGGA